MALTHLFRRFAKWSSRAAGHPLAFTLAVLGIVVWACFGPVFHFSNTWQLFINSGTTIVTLLMVFLIQNTQNRDSAAIQVKLDELIRATREAHKALLDLEELEDEDLEHIRANYQELARQARRKLRQGAKDTGTPEPAPTPPAAPYQEKKEEDQKKASGTDRAKT